MQVPVSPEINGILDEAAELSLRRGQVYVGVEHVYETIVTKADQLPKGFYKLHFDKLKAAAHEMARDLWRGTMPVVGPEAFYTPRCAATTSMAARLAQRLNKSSPTIGHLLLAILVDAHSAPSRAMDRVRIPRGEVIEALRGELVKGVRRSAGGTEVRATATQKSTENKTTERPEPAAFDESSDSRKSTAMESLTRNLTEAAAKGILEPAVGRDKEILTIIETLSRKTKNNVILVGEAGVGKTRIVEGLAAADIHGGAAGLLKGYTFLELNIGALLSGTQYRGAFEEKLLSLLEQLRVSPKTVLFIDEIHLIMGAGTVEGGSVDFANLLKPALARGEIRCIGATTMQEYRKFIEKDPAMERRFQMLRVDELSPAATWEVLNRLRPSLQKHHSVVVSSKAMQAAISLSQRYMPNRQLPDKAIDVLDQACARYRLKVLSATGKIKMYISDTAPAEKVTPHDVRKVVSQMSGIPIEQITAEERLRLSDLERKLRKRIIGQDEAVTRTVAAVKKARAGLADPNRPDAVMLFVGPTGVGKTQLAKSLADNLFGSSSHLVTFDMSEYIEEHSVSRLLGAPPGYVGSDEEGRLFQAVRTAPFSVLLFDEIEKAHRRIFDVFLPILDEGRLKDNRGREVSFRNSIIIFTSNVGAKFTERDGDPHGNSALMNELRKHFRPEFINRIDEIVPFHPLVFEDIRTMLKVCLREMDKRLRERGMKLRVYQRAYEYLAENGYNQDFGARELKRTVERLVMNPISEMLLNGQFESGDVVEVLKENGQLMFRKASHEPEAIAS